MFTWSCAWTFLTEYMDVEAEVVNRGLPQTEFNIPGSILRVEVDTDNPLAYGLPERRRSSFATMTRGRPTHRVPTSSPATRPRISC